MRTRVVLPDGPEDAEIVIVGEAPGTSESMEGKPFVGESGRLLFDEILSSAGIKRSQCLVTNVYWEQPSKNDWATIQEPRKYEQQLTALLLKHPRKLVIACGAKALEFLTGEPSIAHWRGSVLYEAAPKFDFPWPFPVLPMYHPAAILRQWSWLYISKFDALKARAILDGWDLRAPNLSITQFASLMDITGDSVLESFTLLKEALLEYKKASCIAFDIETYRQTITCIGLAKSTQDSIVIPLTGQFDHSQEAELLQILKEILESPMPKIGQNLDYDVQYLARCFNIGVRNVWMDTMVLHSCIHPELPHSLDFLVSVYTNHPYYKEMRKEATSGNYSRLLWEYNGIDCCATFEVAMELFEEAIRTKTLNLFNTISMPVTKTLVRMEYTGVQIDEQIRSSRSTQIEQEITDLLERPELRGVNPNSPKQVKEYCLRAGIKLPAGKGQKKASPSTDETSLLLARAKYPKHSQFFDSILDVRGKRKILSTYLSAKAHEDGRMRTSYRTSATSTGRLSSSSDVFGKGMNLQNVPKSQRDWFIPSEGKIFWACDASQIEARFTAFISGDRRYCEAFIDGGHRDLHSENASRLFGIPIDRTTKIPNSGGKLYRDVGKMATHAMNYKIGPRNLQAHIASHFPELNFTIAAARKFIAEFERLFPGVVRWWKRVELHLQNDRVIYTIFGRRRLFLDRYGEQLFKAAVAHIPQSSAADHINRSLVRIEHDLESIPGATVLLQTHDEIAGECYPEDLDQVRKIVVSRMEEPVDLYYEGIPLVIPAEFAYGSSWGACK